MNNVYDTIIIGGGPAGLAAAIQCREFQLSVLIIEREDQLGGVLKQCIHDGFGITRYGERMTGPEYAYQDIERVRQLKTEILLSTFVLDIEKKDGYKLTVTNRDGISTLKCKSLVLATGCRERTAKQILIHGSRPAGVFTAGCAQHLVNIEGVRPCHKTVILGSGDIGLIMARRLTLEGCEVLGVYEAKSTPSGLARNIAQCLDDYHIPLYLSKTVTRIIGEDRVEAVEICGVDEKMEQIKGSEQIIECDALILSVGLICENELAEKLGVEICSYTKGALVDQHLMSSCEGVFAAGNCLSVNDLVDYVSENGFTVGKSVAQYLNNPTKRELLTIEKDASLSSMVPQQLDINDLKERAIFYLRSSKDLKKATLLFKEDDKIVYSKVLSAVHAAESIRVEVQLPMDLRKLQVSIQ